MKKSHAGKIISFALTLAVIFCGSTVYYAYRAHVYEGYAENVHQRAFNELASSVSSIDSALQKVRYASAGPTLSTLAAQIWRESESAKAALCCLPLGEANLDKYEKFIAQTGDYAYSLLRGGADLSDEALASVASLSSVASGLSAQLNQLKERIDVGDACFSVLSDRSRTDASADFDTAEQDFPEYATLIYDGPFSDHIEKMTPAFINGKEEIDRYAAAGRAAKIFGANADALTLEYESSGKIPCYCFSYGGKTAEITRQGGVLLSLTDSHEHAEAKLDREQAAQKAEEFLAANGFESMERSYFTIFENMITVNFAYVENDIIMYPDLIKVGVALDDGSVVRFDARGYIMNHRERGISSIRFDAEQALASLPKGLTVLKKRFAVIPTSGKNEVLCFETICEAEDASHLIIYTNVETGLREDILLLLESENGVLTV